MRQDLIEYCVPYEHFAQLSGSGDQCRAISTLLHSRRLFKNSLTKKNDNNGSREIVEVYFSYLKEEVGSTECVRVFVHVDACVSVDIR